MEEIQGAWRSQWLRVIMAVSGITALVWQVVWLCWKSNVSIIHSYTSKVCLKVSLKYISGASVNLGTMAHIFQIQVTSNCKKNYKKVSIRLKITQLFGEFKNCLPLLASCSSSFENWANDQTLYFDIVMFAVTAAVSQTGTECQNSLWSVHMGI